MMRGRLEQARWAAMAVVLAVAGLAGAAAPGRAAPSISLSVWSGFPELLPVYQRAAADYDRAHPNVHTTVLATELRDYERKLAASIPSDTAGDVLEVDDATMDRYVEAGLVAKAPADVAKYVRSKSFSGAAQDHAAVGGDVYGVPWFAGIGALFYNTDMFKEAGLSGPPRTMDEMVADAKKLTKTDAQGRVTRSGWSLRLFGAGSGVAEKFAILMWPRGGEILTRNAQGKYKAGYDNDAGRATLKMYIDALYVNKLDTFDIKHDAEAFELGQTAMFARESWVVGDAAKNSPSLKYEAAPLPRDKRWGTIFNPVNLYVPQSTKNAAAAWDFVRFLTQPQYERQMLEQVGWIPLRQDVNYDPVLVKIPQYRAFLFRNKDFVYWSMPAIKDFDEIETKMADRLVAAYRDRSLTGNAAGIARALHAAAEETNNILKRDGLYGE
jgi:multiple sugar transport system substrate-binding protein